MSLVDQSGAFEIELAGVAATTGGAIAGVANPEGADLIITRCILRTTTHSTGAANLDIGIGASATTSNDTLLDGIAVGSAGKIADNIDDQGTNGQSYQLWGASQFLTVTGSATTVGMVGKLFIQYVRA
jgi:hypothetical protein